MPRPWKWIVSGMLLLIVFRLLLPWILRAGLNNELADIPHDKGHVERVSLALWRGNIFLGQVHLQHDKSDAALDIQGIDFQIHWLPLLRGHVVASASVESPRLHLVMRKSEEKASIKSIHTKPKSPLPPPSSLPDKLASLVPFRVDEFKLTDGQMLLTPESEDGTPTAADVTLISRVTIVVQNITNSKAISHDQTAHGKINARLMDQSPSEVEFYLNPVVNPPDFRLSADIPNLDLTRFNPLLDWAYNIDVKKGAFSVYTEAAAEKGSFKGYVKPLMTDLTMVDLKRDKGVVKIVKEAAVGAVIALLKNHQTQRVGAEIPFSGTFENPEIGIWEAVETVLRNAFLQAMSVDFDKNFNAR